ncbi:MAG: carboxypeptidase-like regulatory domain-containing protein [Paludibaculum sp.]
MKFKAITTALVILIATSLILVAQAVNGTLLGTVTDASGASVPNVKVTLTETNTGVARVATTNDSGNYNYPDLPPGTYSVTCEVTGFKKTTHGGVVLQVNTTARVDLVLQPGNVSETIEVSAQAALLQTETATTGSQMSAVHTENMPLGINHNFQNLLNLVPGTSRRFLPALPVLQRRQLPANSGERADAHGQQLSDRRNRQQRAHRTAASPHPPDRKPFRTVDVSTSNFDAELGTGHRHRHERHASNPAPINSTA